MCVAVCRAAYRAHSCTRGKHPSSRGLSPLVGPARAQEGSTRPQIGQNRPSHLARPDRPSHWADAYAAFGDLATNTLRERLV
eukprot:7349716-Prymnesium_polylepis.2